MNSIGAAAATLGQAAMRCRELSEQMEQERNQAFTERDAALADRDRLVAERDAASASALSATRRGDRLRTTYEGASVEVERLRAALSIIARGTWTAKNSVETIVYVAREALASQPQQPAPSPTCNGRCLLHLKHFHSGCPVHGARAQSQQPAGSEKA